jgi:hypothetical protein
VHAERGKLADTGRNIDPLAAGQHHIARKHPQMAIFPTVAFDNISGPHREALGQGGRLTIDWQTHGTLVVLFWELVALGTWKIEHR